MMMTEPIPPARGLLHDHDRCRGVGRQAAEDGADRLQPGGRGDQPDFNSSACVIWR
jgi:hypothetical protein